jgi:predicted CopG family antitoxin
MKRNPPKMVLVEETLHQKLLILKASKGLKSLSEVIEWLLERQKV